MPLHGSTGAFVDDYRFDALATTKRQRFVNGGFERNCATATHLFVGGQYSDCSGIDNAFLHALRGKAAKHHRMNGADACAGLHGNHGLDRHWHVNEDAIAFIDAAAFQAVGHFADAGIQITIVDFCQLSVVGLEDDRRLLRLRLQMTVETVVGGVDAAVGKPLEERCV